MNTMVAIKERKGAKRIFSKMQKSHHITIGGQTANFSPIFKHGST